MLIYPKINPIAFHVGSFAVHWYGIMYLLGFAAAWILARYRGMRTTPGWSAELIADLIFYAALGVTVARLHCARTPAHLKHGLSELGK